MKQKIENKNIKPKEAKIVKKTLGTQKNDKEPSAEDVKLVSDFGRNRSIAKKNIPVSKDQRLFEEKSVSSSAMDKINNFLMKFSRVPLKEKLFFVQHLSLMLRVGISLSKALYTLAFQAQNKYFAKVLTQMAKRVDAGESFSETLKSYPKVFNELFVNMIEAGEASGKLEDVLKQLFIQMKKEHMLIAKVRGAMTYPTVILFALVGISIFMMVVVVPGMTANFIEMKVELPLPTKILVAISNILRTQGPLAVAIIAGLIIISTRFAKTKRGKKFFDAIILKFPVVGGIVRKINLARFARNLSSLLKTDIMIVRAFEISAGVLGNSFYKGAILDIGSKIKKGETITESMKVYPKLFPPVVSQMIAIGEETGDLDNILVELAEFYEEEVNQIMTDLPSLIEPILILVLGLGVGGIAISIIMPMYKITSAV